MRNKVLQYMILFLSLKYRIDEEVPYTDSYKPLIKDWHFLDLDFNYSINKINISLALENLLNFTDKFFEIEAEYIDDLQTISMFTHQSSTIANLTLAYTF